VHVGDGKITYISSKEPHYRGEKLPMKQACHGHSAFHIAAGEAKISIGPLLSDKPFRGTTDGAATFTSKNPTQGGDQ